MNTVLLSVKHCTIPLPHPKVLMEPGYNNPFTNYKDLKIMNHLSTRKEYIQQSVQSYVAFLLLSKVNHFLSPLWHFIVTL